MEYIRILKLMTMMIIISVFSFANTNKLIAIGEVTHINNNIVQIKVINPEKIEIGSKVNLYYKTSSGQEMKVGECKVSRVDNKIVYAIPVDMYIPPTVGLIAKIMILPKKDKVEFITQDQHNTPLLSEDKDIDKKISINSQEYVDKAKKMADDLYKNYKSYSKEKTKHLWNEVIENIQKAVSLNNAEAYWVLALIYEDGYGDTKRDLGKMIDNIIKSAEKGYAEAQYALGEMYEDGDEVVKDKGRAIYWYREAAKQGHQEAMRALEELFKKQEEEIPLQIRGKESKNFGILDMNDLFDLGK